VGQDGDPAPFDHQSSRRTRAETEVFLEPNAFPRRRFLVTRTLGPRDALGMYVAALRITLRVPQSNSLKAKRSVVRHLVDTARVRFGVSASEVEAQDRWQLAVLGFAVVAPSAGHAAELLDKTERFVWSHPEVEVVDSSRHWVEVETAR
jgi:uncharacterized protein YlxP (DUF503 family)